MIAPTGSKRPTRERRWTPRVRSPALLIFIPLIVFVLIGGWLLFMGQPTIWMPLSIIAAILALIAYIMLGMRRVRRILRRYGRFICLNCQYPFEGLADSGLCPECAEPYERAELARLWRNWETGVNKGRPIANDD